MRMLVVDTEAGIEDKWYAAIQPHWPGGLIDRVENNQQALDQLMVMCGFYMLSVDKFRDN